jgi:hypothetical protein
MSRWTKGQSGNPSGRAARTASRQALREAIETGNVDTIKKLRAMADAGDVAAAKLILDRAYPPLRPTDEPIDVPELFEASTHTEAARAVWRAVASGELPPDVGAKLITSIASAAKVEEVDELRRQVQQLHAEKFA